MKDLALQQSEPSINWHSKKELSIKEPNKSVLKRILLIGAGLVGTVALLYVVMWYVIYLALSGDWPFPPLEQSKSLNGKQ